LDALSAIEQPSGEIPGEGDLGAAVAAEADSVDDDDEFARRSRLLSSDQPPDQQEPVGGEDEEIAALDNGDDVEGNATLPEGVPPPTDVQVADEALQQEEGLPAAEEPDDESSEETDASYIMTVQCPDGSSAGDMVQITLESGHCIEIEVPEGIQPGQEFDAIVPEDGEDDGHREAEDPTDVADEDVDVEEEAEPEPKEPAATLAEPSAEEVRVAREAAEAAAAKLAAEEAEAEAQRQEDEDAASAREAAAWAALSEAGAEIAADELRRRRAWLIEVPLFSSHAANTDRYSQFLDAVARVLEVRTEKRKTMLDTMGELGSDLFFVVRGEVEILSDLSLPAFATLGPGKYFGEISLLNGSPCNAFVRSKRTVMLYTLNKKNLFDVFGVFPDVGDAIRGIAVERTQERLDVEEATVADAAIKEQEVAAAVNEDPVFAALTAELEMGLSVGASESDDAWAYLAGLSGPPEPAPQPEPEPEPEPEPDPELEPQPEPEAELESEPAPAPQSDLVATLRLQMERLDRQLNAAAAAAQSEVAARADISDGSRPLVRTQTPETEDAFAALQSLSILSPKPASEGETAPVVAAEADADAEAARAAAEQAGQERVVDEEAHAQAKAARVLLAEAEQAAAVEMERATAATKIAAIHRGQQDRVHVARIRQAKADEDMAKAGAATKIPGSNVPSLLASRHSLPVWTHYLLASRACRIEPHIPCPVVGAPVTVRILVPSSLRYLNLNLNLYEYYPYDSYTTVFVK
jgi:CRP-like cAMP-binding protein